MATFKIESNEGVQSVVAQLENEMIRAESGAHNFAIGKITIDAPLPGVRGILAAIASGERFIRPKYTGTGTVNLEPSLGGFHILELKDEPWIIAPGGYWASEGSVKLSIKRERFLTSLLAGEGFLFYQTQVVGQGKVLIASPGPVEEITLEKGRLIDENKVVLARSAGITLKIRRATRRLIDTLWSGEKAVRLYEGTGKLLICKAPYWRYRSELEKLNSQGTKA